MHIPVLASWAVLHPGQAHIAFIGVQSSPIVDAALQMVTCDVPLQLGFFQIVGIPLFKAMADLFPDAQPMLDGVLTNFKHWEQGTPMEDLPP